MSMMIRIPRRLIERARELGIDVESIIVDFLVRRLSLNTKDEVMVHLELAERYLGEARDYIVKKDPVQASEKMYKAVEESLKALIITYKTPEYEKTLKEGRWWTQPLGKAARRLSKILKEPRLESTWAIAYDLHVWGFHEAKYDIEDVEEDINHIEWIVKYTKEKIVTKHSQSTHTNSHKPPKHLK